MSRTLLLGVLLSVAAAPAALAQPNPDAAPTAGTVTLAAGFSPDPHAVDLMAGGPVEAADADPTCAGYVGAAPSVALDYGGGGTLHLFVRSSSDTVLLVRTPGGDWLCNDDEEALNPGLRVEDAESGRYAVWVGTFSDTASADTPATLYVSAREAPALDPAGTPSAGTVTLAAGFTPDPHEVTVTVGGPASAGTLSGCSGFVDAAPSVVLAYDTHSAGPLYVYARAEGDDDLTLVVIGPDGTAHCNDDAAGLDPGLVIEPAEAGRYAVWVGTYSSRARTEAPGQATLFFSGTEGPTAEAFFEDGPFEDGVYEGGEDISLFAAPAHGTLTLDAGFGAREVTVEAGGADAVSVSGSGCAGYIMNGQPDVNVLYRGEGDVLAFHAASDDDATLVVNLPDGSWRCSDDELGRDPVVVIEAPEGGLYNAWVGTYSQGSAATATLHILERDPR
ncbi:MAG TPA: hypothetical protein VK002_11850 [Rubricoccaceae bacterium]|nr:hypothetical protein [Rubricoccaceae bacterium]